MFLKVSKDIQNNKEYLCEVDAAIGDGDHGISMKKGFMEVEKALKEKKVDEIKDIGEIFKIIGMSLVKKIGGAAGPIFSTIFISASKIAKNKKNADLNLFYEMFEQSLRDVCKRGNSELGDKTLIDALDPAVQSLKSSTQKKYDLEKAFKLASKKAAEGVERTKNLQPRQGKSRYLQDRAVGHQDAGATSISIIFESMKDYIIS